MVDMAEGHGIPVGHEEFVKRPRRLWRTLLVNLGELTETIQRGIPFAFMGGMCNEIVEKEVDEEGVKRITCSKQRNEARDGVNQWLANNLGWRFFDPQISKETHRRGYDWEQDYTGEMLAMENARYRVLMIGERTLAGVTMMEIARAMGRKNPRLAVWWHGGEMFSPEGLLTEEGKKLHYKEMKNAACNMRKELVGMIQVAQLQMPEEKWGERVRLEFNNDAKEMEESEGWEMVEIEPDRLEAEKVIQALRWIFVDKKKVVVRFMNHEKNEQGAPELAEADWPIELDERQMVERMKEYQDEGNKARRVLREMLDGPADGGRVKVVKNEAEVKAAIQEGMVDGVKLPHSAEVMQVT